MAGLGLTLPSLPLTADGTSGTASSSAAPFSQAAIAGATAPNGPGAYPLRIGSVTFWTDEVPAEMPIGGGSQMEETHQLIGGGRIVQTFGPSMANVGWSGRFWAPNTDIRIAQLRLLMVNAVESLISWKGEQYLGVITHFQPKRHGAYADYEIEITLTTDENGAFSLSSPTSLDAQVASLFVQAQNANGSILSSPDVPAAAQPAMNAMQQPISALQSTIQNAGPIASNITTAGPAISSAATEAAQAIQAFQALLPSTNSQFVNASMLLSSVTAIGLNAARGQSAQQNSVQGLSTFALAATQYGDVTQAFKLSTANGLISPFTSAMIPTAIKYPPFQQGT